MKRLFVFGIILPIGMVTANHVHTLGRLTLSGIDAAIDAFVADYQEHYPEDNITRECITVLHVIDLAPEVWELEEDDDEYYE